MVNVGYVDNGRVLFHVLLDEHVIELVRLVSEGVGDAVAERMEAVVVH